MTIVAHLLNRRLDGFRIESTDDGAGGQVEQLVAFSNFDAMVVQPSASEMQVANQWESRHTHNIYFNADADVQRNDRYQGNDENGELQQFRVMSVIRPSRPDVYTKAIVTLSQFQPPPEGS